MADKIPVEIEIGSDGILQFRKLTDAAEEFGTKGQKSLDKFSGAMDVFTGVLGAQALIGGLKTVTAGVVGLFQTLVVDGVKAASEQEDAINKLNQSLLASGKYSKETSQDIQAYAAALQNTTKFADEAVVEASALIQSLGQLDKEGLKKATGAATDLSAALGIDLHSAALLVGKAAAGETGTLGRYGIKIQEGADKAETFARALDGINSRFGGAAAAQVNTYSGALALLNNQYGEFLESIGNVVIGSQSLVVLFKETGKIFGLLQGGVDGNTVAIQEFVQKGILYAIDGVALLVPALDIVARGFIIGANAAGLFISTMTKLNLPIQILSLFSDKVDDVRAKMEALGNNAVAGAVKAFTEETGLKGALPVLEALRAKIAAVQEVGGATADRLVQGNKGVTASIVEQTEAQKKLAEQGKAIAEALFQKDPQAEFEAKQAALEAAVNANLITYQIENEAVILLAQERNAKLQEIESKRVDFIISQNEYLLQDGKYKNLTAIQDNNARLKEILAQENLTAKDRLKIEQAFSTQSKTIEDGRRQAITSSLDALSSLQNAKTKEIAVFGKAAAIARATIDTYTGAQAAASALAGIPIVGPALAIGAATAFIAAGVARVAQIAGVQLETGITEVPSGFPNDTFAARLTTGERVVDAGTNQDLKAFLSSSQNMVGYLAAILGRLQSLENRVTVNIGSRTIMDEVREGLTSGRSFDV